MVAQWQRTLCRRHERWFRSLGQEDALEEGMAIHFSILTWRIPRTEEPGGLPSTCWQELYTTKAT